MSFNSQVLKDNPVINLRHEDTSGTVSNDSSGNANHGTYVGSPTLNQRSLLFLPHQGKSVVMGTGKRVTIPAGLITTTTYVYEFLIKPTNVTGLHCLAHDGTNGIYLNDDKLSFYYSASHHDSTKAVIINKEVLLHVAVTAGDVEYFINRVPAGTATGAPIFSATTLYSEDAGANELEANVCEFAAYGAVFAAAKIRNRYREAFSVGFRKVIANSAPYLHLPMAETVGNTSGFDVSGNDLDGTYSNVTLNQAAMLHQMRGGSALFDGAAGHLVVSDNATIQNVFDSGGAAGILLNATSDGEGDAGRLLDKNGWHIAVTGESGGAAKIRFTQAFSTTDGVWETTSTDLTLANDECVLIEYDNADVANDPIIYIAGVSVAITETSTPVGTRTSDVGSDLYIGNNSAGSATFHGRLSNAFLTPKFTDTDVTQTNVPLQINEAFKSRYAAEMISYKPTGYWRGNETSGTVMIDYGSGGNDGVINGSPSMGNADSPLVNEPGHTTVLYDGSNDDVDLPVSLFQIGTSGARTIVSWAKNLGGTYKNIVTAGTSGNNHVMYIESSSAVVEGNGDQFDAVGTDHAGSADFKMHVGVFDLDNLFVEKIVDTVSEAKTTITGTTNITPITHAAIGGYPNLNEYASGIIAETGVFPFALLPHEGLDIYEMASFFTAGLAITGSITESLPATDFYVRASELDTGAFIADAPMLGDNTYTLNFSQTAGYEAYADEVLLTCLPKTGTRRLNSTAYAVGDYYLPADVTANNHIYKVTVAGTTAASEPTLDHAGGTTTDGGVTVQDMGPCPTPQTQISYAEMIEL